MVPGDLNLTIAVSVTKIRLTRTETLSVWSTRRMATVRVAEGNSYGLLYAALFLLLWLFGRLSTCFPVIAP